MTRKILIAAMVLAMMALVYAGDASQVPAVSALPAVPTFMDLVESRIIFLESSGHHEGVWGDHHTSYGKCQFKRRTFAWMSAQSGIGDLHWKSEADQIILLRWALNHGLGHHWSTYRAAVAWARAEQARQAAIGAQAKRGRCGRSG